VLEFYGLFPQVAIAGLMLIIGIAVWMIWRNISPAAQGISLGYYETIGRYSGRKLLKRIKGTLVESTSLFLSTEMELVFKQVLNEDIDAILRKKDDADLRAAKASFENFELSKACRIIVTRDRMFGKQILIQWGHVDKPLSEFASHDPESKFTFGMGFLSQGVISGVINTLPQKWDIYKLGKVTVHLFLPDVPQSTPYKFPPEYLAKIALYVRSNVEIDHILKSMRDQLKEKDRELDQIQRDRSLMATEMDGQRTATRGFQTTKGKLPDFGVKKFDMLDFIAFIFPTIGGYYVASLSVIEPIIGVFLGALFGAFLIFRRR